MTLTGRLAMTENRYVTLVVAVALTLPLIVLLFEAILL
jgi:hypothetical protein